MCVNRQQKPESLPAYISDNVRYCSFKNAIETLKAYKEGVTNVIAYTENIFTEIKDGESEQMGHSFRIKERGGNVAI